MGHILTIYEVQEGLKRSEGERSRLAARVHFDREISGL
jgi:hypothetical protein